MEFNDVVRRRRMVRDFADRPLEPATIDKVLQNALHAPSAGFAQGWAFLVLVDQPDRERFWPYVPNQIRSTPGLKNAPLIIVPLAHKAAYFERYFRPEQDWENGTEEDFPAPYWFIDTAMSSMLMLLTAVDEGLGALFFWLMPDFEMRANGRRAVGPHLDAFRGEFGIPSDYQPVGAIAIGYRAPDLAPQRSALADSRKPVRDVVHWGQWRSPESPAIPPVV
jgi:nitroreductase